MRLLFLTGLSALVLAMTFAAPAWSQSGAETGGALSDNLKYFDFFVVKGGWIAWVIILISVVALALTIEYCLTIRRTTIVPPAAVRQTQALIEEKRYLEAIQFTAEEPSMLSYAVNAALLEAANGFPAMERALDESIDERSSKLFRKVEYLSIIGAVSPMLGLFGTVVGMILLFAEIHAADSFPRAQLVADNVAIALVTTFWGLAVAIPSLSVYAVFQNRIDVLTAECALTADRILAVFKPNPPNPSVGGKPSPPATPAKVPHALPT